MALVYTFGETDYNDGETSGGFQPENFIYGGRITFSAGGTINQLGGYARTASETGGFNPALYDTSENLVADGGVATLSNSTLAWVEPATFTPVAVAEADYFILYSSESNDARYGIDTGNDGSFATETWANFPQASLTSFNAEGDSGSAYGGRALFTAGAGGTPVVLGLASEADTSQAMAAAKAKAIGLNTETDLAQALTVNKTRIIGLNTEIDLAQIMSIAKAKAIGLNTETDLALAMSAARVHTIGLNTETDLAQALAGVSKSKAIGLNAETDVALPMTVGGGVLPTGGGSVYIITARRRGRR